jgi:hypothetical protein
MSETISRSAGEFARTGLIKRGVPIIPSEIDPPLSGMLTIKDLLILSRIEIVLIKSMIINPTKKAHSFLEKELKTELIWSFMGNLKLRI